ncbi:MAG: lysophospholipid acyltransferase family protein [Tannerella sp.]|jgi:1-acyl-sn-glycerol-3-phosphate acyltransferase|nr:lysophospholipid acyltransferase family protein [Tannerella sp.]
MKKVLSRYLLKLAGWKEGPLSVGDVPKCVICVAPHTSNWDLVIGKLLYNSWGRKAHFLMKKEWFFFPMNLFFRWMGGIPVDRARKRSVTDQMAEQIHSHKRFHLAVTPEGTRQNTPEWKRGFYYIALKAGVPILLAYIDYYKKEAGVKTLFYPTGNVEADLACIRSYYRDVTACHPHKFAH